MTEVAYRPSRYTIPKSKTYTRCPNPCAEEIEPILRPFLTSLWAIFLYLGCKFIISIICLVRHRLPST